MPETQLKVEAIQHNQPKRGGNLVREVIGPKRREVFFPEEQDDYREIAELQEQLQGEHKEDSTPSDPIMDIKSEPWTGPKHSGVGRHRRQNPLGLLLSRGLHIVSKVTKETLLRKPEHVKSFRHESSPSTQPPSEPWTPIMEPSGDPLPQRTQVKNLGIGDTFIGNTTNTKIVVGSRIGGGADADIYETADRRAVKVFKPIDKAGLQGENTTPEQEAAIQASIDDPNVASVHLVDSLGERYRPYMVMELALGGNLRDRIAKEGIPPEEGLLILTQTAQALLAIHDAGWVHRDFKPQNVLLTDTGAKVTDFGIAARQGSSTTVPKGGILGSLPYMAPERFSTNTEIAQSDMYSWGVSAYQTLTGEFPYEVPPGVDAITWREIHRTQEPIPVAQRLGERMTRLHSALEYIIAKTLAKDPAQRYADFGVLLDNLEAIRRQAELGHFSGDTVKSVDQDPALLAQQETVAISSRQEEQPKQSWFDVVKGLRNKFRGQSSPHDSEVSLDELLSPTDTTKR